MTTPEQLVDINFALGIQDRKPRAPGTHVRINLLQGSLDTLTEILRDPSPENINRIADRTAEDAAYVLRSLQERTT